ncbi:hypothetical protein E6P09_18860 (plasmid) [Haloferax mediterranei ATCC 33500]|uniref:Uncharacterized protein n=1 Tax=Haloferax mediterranei (strain ATCC 33500 / DSM 1411 / JCM 8866 / NBRC 14739 / NCIMB 2177 / R-4) TaxID=523841 RepID=I3R9C7_HALMT|nr:hypothetical protein [Haloferax mediterranei]AFK20837.1 hypothetical protein HFX_4147 [Haloferax mediterranei ATCC 33500]AHZ24046.1 hypothetical protein BM92_19795 [Haloferax mediterranei ATCC 33500]ELZ97632.1 hypothetical protein C439_16988 [Haloferax mediterranei ATCC 33500]MDX5989718.1 hypothetical protein [Haloferax mediterranei ATCC 33500]QCQ77382.1 hypothetical protein E6P09_18860 [Haloferax mediterranei ATCC 33500]
MTTVEMAVAKDTFVQQKAVAPRRQPCRMVEQILLPARDARRIAGLLREVENDDKGEAGYYADLLDDHADEHAFEDHFTDIGPIPMGEQDI